MNLFKKKNNTTESEAELNAIELCIKGNRSAQRAIYERLAPKMFPVCLRYVGLRDKAEDVLQDGFVTLYAKISTYKGEGSFEGWARKIFVNTALMYLRKNDALKMSEELDNVRSHSSSTVSALDNLGYQELIRLIAELPAGFRTVFNLFAIEGLSHKEISEILNISEVTSRSQYSRARQWLQNKIKGES